MHEWNFCKSKGKRYNARGKNQDPRPNDRQILKVCFVNVRSGGQDPKKEEEIKSIKESCKASKPPFCQRVPFFYFFLL